MPHRVHREHCRLADPVAGHRLALIHLLDCMMEAAGRHVERLGWGIPDLQARGLSWVLARYHLQIRRPPPTGLAIATWHAGQKGLLAFRDFLVGDEEGGEVAAATSAWLLIHTASRRPARLDRQLAEVAAAVPRALEDDFAPLPAAGASAAAAPIRVQDADIDINRHVNNIVYLEWAFSQLPADAASRLRPVSLEAAFLAEALLGDDLICRTQRCPVAEGIQFLQTIERASERRELVRFRSRWA